MNKKADNTEIFDIIFNNLKETRTTFFANFISVFLLLLSALTLLLSPENIKSIIEINSIYYSSIISIIFFGSTYSRYLLKIKEKSLSILSYLDELEYMDHKYYQNYKISKYEFIPMFLSIIFMFLVLIVVLSWIKFIF